MKKISLLILIVLTGFFFARPSYAYTFTDDITGDFTWTYAVTEGYEYAQSNRLLIDFQELEMTLDTGLGSYEEVFVPVAGAYRSVVEVYDHPDYGTPLATYNIVYEAAEATGLMFLSDNQGNWSVDLSAFEDDYMQITLMINPNPPEPIMTNIVTVLNHLPTLYWFEFIAIRNVLTGQSIADLPFTSGNPYLDGMTGTVWEWNYNSNTNLFSATVQYYQEYQITIPNVGFSDPGFLSRVESIDYYTVDDEKFFQFNFMDNPNVLLTGSGQFAQPWNGFAIWNLTTNEFIQWNRAKALTYIDVTDDREIFGYLYLPGIPIDDLIAVSGDFNYRYGYKNIWGTQKYEDWQKTVFHLEADEQSLGSTSFFEGQFPQFAYDVMVGSVAALAVGAFLTMIPGLQPIGLPLMTIGLVGIVAAAVDGYAHLIQGHVDEIETISPSGALRNKLNHHYTMATGTQVVLPSNAQVHKLFFGLFTKTGTNAVEPDASTLEYSEITWITNGQVYYLDGDMIDSIAILDEDDQAALPPKEKDWFDRLVDVYNENKLQIWILFGAIIGFSVGAYKSLRNFITFVVIFGLIVMLLFL